MYSRRAAFVAACAGILVFGVAMTALGSLLPSLMQRFQLGPAAAASLFPLLTLGLLAGSVVFGPIVDRYGYKALLATCIALILLGIEGLAAAPSIAIVGAALVLVGFGGGVVNGATSALVADISEEGARGAALSLMGVFFGVGALGMPFLLALLLSRFSYGPVTASIGAAIVLPLLYVLAIRFPPPKQAQGFPLRSGLGLLRDPVLLLFGLALFFESGMETTVSGWTATFVQQTLAIPVERALFFLSAYWVGMTVGRVVLSLNRRVGAVSALYISIALAFAGAMFMFEATRPTGAALGCFLIGFGFAAVFPLIFGFAADRFPTLSGTAFSMLLVMGLIGGTILPWLVGVLAARVGLRDAWLVVPAACLGLATAFSAARRVLRRVPAT
ncbi:MAG TPA: MFS transporter [Longimicrobiales bacterium]